MVEFDVQNNLKEFENNLKIQVRPSDLQDKVKEVVIDYWDVFFEDGFCRPIQGFSFQIETGKRPPIFCKPPRYGPHESKLMRKLFGRRDEMVWYKRMMDHGDHWWL